MCYGCYEEYGKPEIVNESTIRASGLIDTIYQYHLAGGDAHIVVDDFNIEDQHLDFCLNRVQENPAGNSLALLDAERDCLTLMRGMSVAERASALAIHEGWLNAKESEI